MYRNFFRHARVAQALRPVPASVNRKALGAGDTLCGLQRHYCAGSGPTAVVFTSFAGLEKHLRSTRPGDDFMLVSVRQLPAAALFWNQRSARSATI
jgi:hypothetical protein